MSIHFEWDPSQETGCFKIIHKSGATYSSFVDHHDLEEAAFRIFLEVLDEEVQRKVSPESYEMSFKSLRPNRENHPQVPVDTGRRSLLANLLGKGHRRRRRRGQR